MSRALYLVFLIPLLPLIGVFWNHMAVMVLAGLAWAVFLGVLMNVMGTSIFAVFLTQIPALLLLTFVRIKQRPQLPRCLGELTAPGRPD